MKKVNFGYLTKRFNTVYQESCINKTISNFVFLLANPRLFDSAAHYWPFDRRHGIVDMKTNITGDKHGKIENILFKGPGNGVLHTNGKAWVDLGNFTGSCLAEPARCTEALTVFLWLKYSPNKRRRYLLGTSSHLAFSEGFTIYKDSEIKANNSIVIRVNNGQREWTGSLTLKPDIWSHVMFTWHYKLGLALFQNCNQMALISEGTLKTTRRSNRSNILEHYLSISGAQIAKPELGVRASYDDLTVFYRKLESHDRNWICLNKLGEYNIEKNYNPRWHWMGHQANSTLTSPTMLIMIIRWFFSSKLEKPRYFPTLIRGDGGYIIQLKCANYFWLEF